MQVINIIQEVKSQLTVKLANDECYKVGNNATFEILYNGTDSISQVKIMQGTVQVYSWSASSCKIVNAIYTNVLLQCNPNNKSAYQLSFYNPSDDQRTQYWSVTATYNDGSLTSPINVTICNHDQQINIGKVNDVSLILILIPLVVARGQLLHLVNW